MRNAKAVRISRYSHRHGESAIRMPALKEAIEGCLQEGDDKTNVHSVRGLGQVAMMLSPGLSSCHQCGGQCGQVEGTCSPDVLTGTERLNNAPLSSDPSRGLNFDGEWRPLAGAIP